MNDATIVTVDEALSAKTNFKRDTKAAMIGVPTDRPVRIEAVTHAKMRQKMQIFDGEGRHQITWEGRGEGRTLGADSRTFPNGTLMVACSALYGYGWVVSGLKITSGDRESRKVVVSSEGGEDFPGDWNDVVVTISW